MGKHGDASSGVSSKQSRVATWESASSDGHGALEGKKRAFLGTADQEVWENFLLEFNRKVNRKIDVEEFKEEMWDIVVEFGEPILMGTGLDREASDEQLSKMISLGKPGRRLYLDPVQTALL